MIEFLKLLYSFKGILFYRTLASLRADVRGLYLGYAWWLLEPIFNTILYYCIFGLLLGTKKPDFIGYLLLGSTIYQWFSTAINKNIGSITAKARIYRQIHLPKFLFSLVGIFSTLWKFVCVSSIIFIYIIITSGVSIGWHLLWLPFLTLVQLFVIFGFAINLSIFAAYIRDLQTFVTVLFRAVMFLSAIFWDVEKVPDHLRTLFFANPVANLIHAFRAVILHGESPIFSHMIYLIVLSVVMIQFGMWLHRRVDGHILKHVQS